MMVIRPIESTDIDALLHMAENAGIGVTTLPPDRDYLARRIERSVNSFAQKCEPKDAFYFFAMEEVETGQVVGVCGIEGRVGLSEVWYNYRVSTSVNASAELGVHKQTPTLYLTNDMTDHSEVCSLFLDANHRRGDNGQLLSKCRFLFLADHPQLFSEKVFAEMRGFSDEQGTSPFWEALGRKFFSMEFSTADHLVGLGNKAFIAELMPKHPIYLPFLDKSAQAVIGKVHDNTRPALEMLKREGFHYNGLIDIFDGGPNIEAFIPSIRAVSESFKRHALVAVNAPEPLDEDEPAYMISNRGFSDFRVALVPESYIKSDTVTVPTLLAEQMKISSGDDIRCVRLRPERRD